MKTENSYYLGLDVGTESVGYAVTDEQYGLLKFKGEPMWGVHLFDQAELNQERRGFRSSRRRLDRRQARVKLVQELFASEISKTDPNFFIRIRESMLYPEDTKYGASLFADPEYRDADYYREYPTIHHLIMDLIDSDRAHDVRQVYLAVAWLVAHRGHFLNEISEDNLEKVTDIQAVYQDFEDYFQEEKPWERPNLSEFGNVLSEKCGVKQKLKKLSEQLVGAERPFHEEHFPYRRGDILKLLCGGTVAPKELFENEDYQELPSFSLESGEEELESVLAALGDDAELIRRIKALYDWAILNRTLQGKTYISEAKIDVYEQHKADLEDLKFFIGKYSHENYTDIFRDKGKNLYEAYLRKGGDEVRKNFYGAIKRCLQDAAIDEADQERYTRMMHRLEQSVLCPKQVCSDNRVLPHQVYLAELKAILKQASAYLSFLTEADESGYTVAEKLISIFRFRIPYFVGPLDEASPYAWIVRRSREKIYPWNFEACVDLDKSEQAFIDRMTNSCTYLPDAKVLPKRSLCYEKFQMLNELNPLSVNGRRLPPEVKQRLFEELCTKHRKMTKKSIRDFLRANNLYTEEELATLSGVDDSLTSSLSSLRSFSNLLKSGKLGEADAEAIIRRRTYTESRAGFLTWLEREYPTLSEDDRRYLASLNFKDFGRLSKELLCELYGSEREGSTGEAMTILERMWNENVTLMEILSERYTYGAEIERRRREFFEGKSLSLDERLESMYVSNSVKRSILRSLDVVGEVVKATGHAPEKIMIEMARGGKPEEKNKRISSRRQQIKALYDKCDGEEVRELSAQLEAMGESADARLQSDRLFLYYMQLGKCMYTETPISLSELMNQCYDIDHIYPRSKVKDDSVLNNKVLVLSEVNGNKKDVYPISSEIRHARRPWWESLRKRGLITEEKYKRLIRHEPFDEQEQWGFINRQLVETRQSTKVLATVLRERYPNTQIVYVKAGLVSEFRQEFDLLKSRSVNDLHHAKDAYLNVVVGNVYHERFTKQWFLENRDTYNLKVKTLFEVCQSAGDKVLWNGQEDLAKVKRTVQRNNAIHLTQYAFCKQGKLFNQPEKAKEGLFPLKKGLPTEKYGGYNDVKVSFFWLVRYAAGKKLDVMVMPVELPFAETAQANETAAADYAKRTIAKILGKEVSSVEFPLGLRKLKVRCMFEFDGVYRACLTGKSGGGRSIVVSTMCPLSVGYDWEKYIKRLERFVEKKKECPSLKYSEKYDQISAQQNVELYDVLTEKLKKPPYQKRPANPSKVFADGRERFLNLDIEKQARCLLQMLLPFSRVRVCNLESIGGTKTVGSSSLSACLSNWKKYYRDVRIVDSSASGLYESKTDNLLQLL